MKGKLPLYGAIAGILLVVLILTRFTGGSEDLGVTNESSRYLVCEACGTISVLPTDSTFVRDRYEAGEVRMIGAEPRFKCPSCEELALRVETLSFLSHVVRCDECGKDLVGTEHGAAVAVDTGAVKLGKDKQLHFLCDECGDFHGRMVLRDAPMDPEQQ